MVHASFAVRGGAERYVTDLSAALVARGHEVRLFCARDRLSARLPGPRKLRTHLGDLVDPTGLPAGRVREFKPDVVHVHNWQGLGVLPVARLARRYPTCHTVHDYALADPNNTLANRGRSAALDLALRLRSVWLVRRLRPVVPLWPAARTRDVLLRHVPGAARLDGPVLPLAVASGVALPPGDPAVLLFLGALADHKGIDALLAAWPHVDGGTLLIAGDGPRRADVVAAARAHPSIEYLGYLDAAGREAALRRAGWLVFPSRTPENFPLSCVEALVAGRPVVTSAVARPAMASDRSLLVADDLPAALRTAVTMPAAEHRERSAAAATDGRALDWNSHVDAVVSIYETVAAA